MRRMVVGVPSNSLPGVFIALCRSKPVTETPSAWLASELSRESKNRRWPTDVDFHERWLKAQIYGSRACQVILECLEESFDHHEAVSFTESTIEHVLPQTLTAEWELALGQSASALQSEWLHTIGNLTLTGYNPELGNKSYAEKVAIFASSHFELNRFFGSCQTWGATEIRSRSEYLFNMALSLSAAPSFDC